MTSRTNGEGRLTFILVGIFLKFLTIQTINKLPWKPKFIFKYVDEYFVILKNHSIITKIFFIIKMKI